MKCQSLFFFFFFFFFFFDNIRKTITSLSSAELAKKVVKVK